jgi:hypothetical protein
MSEKEKSLTVVKEAPTLEYVKVDSLKPRTRNVNVIVKIVSRGKQKR